MKCRFYLSVCCPHDGLSYEAGYYPTPERFILSRRGWGRPSRGADPCAVDESKTVDEATFLAAVDQYLRWARGDES